MMPLLTVFSAQFFSVFFLVTSSKLNRDDRWKEAAINSWFITATQVVFVGAVSNTAEPLPLFVAAGLGGSLAVVAAHFVYKG